MWRKLSAIAIIFVAFLWAINSSILMDVNEDMQPHLLSHRGVHQICAGSTLERDTCTANPVHPLTNSYIENTIQSMEAAFAAGAELVELDIQLTPDGEFAVFHDWSLEC